MTFDPEYRMVTLYFLLIFIKKSKIGILEPNILAGTRDQGGKEYYKGTFLPSFFSPGTKIWV